MTTKKVNVEANTAAMTQEELNAQLPIVQSIQDAIDSETAIARYDMDGSKISGEMTLADTFENTAAIFYSSIVNDGSRASAIKIYNAMNNSSKAIRDVQAEGGTINVENIIAHQINLLDEETGEMVEMTRVVLIDDQGIGYHACANGIVGSIQKIVAIVGRAPWTPALPMKPRLVKTRKNFYTLTIELV